jgi:Fe-coproporphyrin III synthase
MAFTDIALFVIQKTFFKVHYPIGFSFDITNQCNLRCKHCYFLYHSAKTELQKSELLDNIKALKKKYPTAIHAAWIGGEPLLRADLLPECTALFPMNMVVTNGTIELPKLAKCIFNVSVDGTKRFYEKIRGADVYDKVKHHANRDDIHVNITCVLNKINSECLDQFVKEWKNTKVQGISFSFYTPQKGNEDDLYLSGAEKDIVIDHILALKKVYGDFILNSKSVLKSMRPANAPNVTQNCASPKAFISIDSRGDIKKPCVMGPTADCTRCGCVVPFEIDSVVNRRHFDSLRIIKKFYTGK